MSNDLASALTTDPNTPPTAGLSAFERVVDTFIAPSKTFEDLLRRSTWTSWIVPFLVLTVFSLGSAWIVQHEVGFDRVYMNSLHSSPAQEDRLNSAAPADKARAIDIGTKITGGIAYGAPVLLIALFGIYSLMIWAGFNFGLGAQTNFWQVFAVTFYAALPYVIRSLLIMITVHFGGNGDSFEYKNPVGTNPAYYMPDAAGWLKGFLGTIDLIQLWSLVLMIIGMSVVAKKSFTQSAVIVGIFWFLSVLFATAGGAFGG